MKNCQEWVRNERQFFGQKKTTKKAASKGCVYHVLKNNSAESKPTGLSWECCGLASPAELNWNALFVFQQACKSWQGYDQLFNSCWTTLWVQLLCLARGPAEKLRVKQVVGLVWNKTYFLHGRKMFLALERCTLVHSSEAGACCVNSNVSSSLGNYFILAMLHRLA